MGIAVLFGALTALAAPADPGSPTLSSSLRRGLDRAERREWLQARTLADEDSVVVVFETDGWPLAELPPGALTAGNLVQARVRWEDLPRLASQAGVRTVREPWLASPKGSAGAVVSEGYGEVMDGDWYGAGERGRGVTVVVLDVGFGGYQDLQGTELPGRVTAELGNLAESSTHGTAVAEIVHDFAPDARLRLHHFATDVEFVASVEALGEIRGIDVVNASIGFDNIWHADGTSPMTRAVDALVETGVVWVGAAGNENDKYRHGDLTDVDGNGRVEIDGQEGVWVEAPGGGLTRVSFRWSETMGGAWIDLDLEAYNEDGSLCAASTDPQDGDDLPLEKIDDFCSDDWIWVVPTIEDPDDLEGLTGWLYGTYGLDEAAWSGDTNLTLPGDTHLGLSVGACSYQTGQAPDYSSRGPTEDNRPKPDFCAPTDVSTVTFGQQGFEGTSAAAPHVTGLVALALSAGEADADGIADYLAGYAVDMGEPGRDMVFGRGAVRSGPVPEGCGCGGGVPGPWWPAGLIAWRRRRRDARRLR